MYLRWYIIRKNSYQIDLHQHIPSEAVKEQKKEIVRSLLDVLSLELIAEKTGLSMDEVEELKRDIRSHRGERRNTLF